MDKIQSAYVWEKKKLDDPDLEYDATGKRPAWIKIKNQVKTKFLTVSFGYGNKQYVEFLHSGFHIPTNYTKEELGKLYDQFAETYDDVVKGFGDELGAIQKAVGLLSKLKNTSSTILDIGSGTGRGAEVLAKKGYKNLTLLELSKEMLAKARQKPPLQHCTYIEAEFVTYETQEKYDAITSFFAFGSPSYFSEQETITGLEKIKKMLKEKGVVLVVGDIAGFEKEFTPLFSGDFELKKGLKTQYFIGQKK
tara:strand:- start:36 stop:785 length:750 start_codon:yes stop_codon:yes gene_type:complete